MTLLEIDGKRCLPVRALPYVTGWHFSPLDVAEMLRRPESHSGATCDPVFAYKLDQSTRTHIALHPGQFAAISITARSAVGMSAQEQIKALPAGVFVFRDDFAAFYTCWQSSPCAPDTAPWLEEPLLSDDDTRIVFEGLNLPPPKKQRINARCVRLELLASLIQRIEDTALELGIPFQRNKIAGTKADLIFLLEAVGVQPFTSSQATLAEDLAELGCRFNRGTRNGDLSQFAAAILNKLGRK